jgi:peptidoglycan/LPS O-acetylase OafA/YrhL
MRTQKRLEKISTALSLVGLALGFSVLGLLIVSKEHDGGASITGGILGILLGAAFLIAACLHWKCGDRIQGGFQVEEVPAAEILSEMRQAAEVICSF